MKPATKAVVLGGGISGLLAARVLSAHYGTVTILEQREVGADGTFVKGVPQSEHLHVLLARGQQILERLFPGLLAECGASTGAKNDWGQTTFWANPFGIHPRHPTGVETWQFSRDRLDRAIMRRLRELPNVTVQTAEVSGLVAVDGRVTGVRLASADATAQEMAADLVVECRGRSSKIVSELVELGYPEPPTVRVENELGYSSQFFQLPEGERLDWKLVYVQVRPGLVDRGGALCEIEDGKIVATLIGSGEHRPGAGPEELLAFADSIGHDPLSAPLKVATPIDRPRLWRNLGNRRRQFGKLDRWPAGLVVLGDALCCFNPVYGQGMTVAAVEAEALGETLTALRAPREQRWEAAFQRRLEGLLFIPWLMSSTEDQRNRRLSDPDVATRMIHAYLDLVLQGAVRDPHLHAGFLRVMHMVSSPASLVGPRALTRVAARTLQRLLSGGGRIGPGGLARWRLEASLPVVAPSR